MPDQEEALPENVMWLDPTQVQIKEDLPRFREHYDKKKLRELGDSLAEKGQIQPIAINRNYELVAGGRRLAACMLKGIKVLVIFSDAIDSVKMRELEVEENVQREDFTPAEHCLAIKELHELKQKLNGVARSGPDGSGWSLDKTAELVGKTKGSVHQDIELADLIEKHPELKKCKKKSDIKKAGKALEALAKHSAGVEKHTEEMNSGKPLFALTHGDSREYLAELKDNSIDIFLTDPPYGIDIHDNLQGISGDVSAEGFKYQDDTDYALEFARDLAQHFFRLSKETSHGFIFCAPEHFNAFRSIFEKAGWNVYFRPLIWIKSESGSNNNPSMWPSPCYESMLYIRRDKARFVRQGRPDWFRFDPVSRGSKIHQAEKPVEMLQELLSRVADPGMTMLDACAGSGSSIEAGMRFKLFPIGIERLPDAYNSAIARLVKVQKEIRDGQANS